MFVYGEMMNCCYIHDFKTCRMKHYVNPDSDICMCEFNGHIHVHAVNSEH
jgi:hypothetical protein